MKKNLFKITILAIVGLVFVSTSFAQPSKKEDMKDKKTSYEKFIPNELPKFNEVTGTVKVEGKDENKKIYVVTDKKEKILIEVTGGPRFNFEQKPFIEKKDFEKGKKTDSKNFYKDKGSDFPEGFDKDRFEKFKKDFEKGNFEMPHKFSYTESLIKLKGKKVTLVGKYNSDKTIFNVIGIIEK